MHKSLPLMYVYIFKSTYVATINIPLRITNPIFNTQIVMTLINFEFYYFMNKYVCIYFRLSR